MWVKICGITSANDAKMASSFRPDAIGLIFYSRSRRNVSLEEARQIVRSVPSGILKVGVFVDKDWEYLEKAATGAGLDMIQWHGEPFSDTWYPRIEKLGIPWIDVRKIFPDQGVPKGPFVPFKGASHFLFECAVDRAPGGNGQTWDYTLLRKIPFRAPLILSGGLNASNVGSAVRMVRPFGVDVASGVESEPGKKDAGKIERFMEEVRLNAGG